MKLRRGGANEFFFDEVSTGITYCDIEGGYEGEGNLDSDPLFVDEDDGNYRLTEFSPCVNAGTAVGAPSDDFEGDARPFRGGYDMGADEYAVNTSPVPIIASPPDGAVYAYNDAITLTGSAADAEDGSLEGDALVWASSEDGPLGTGVEVVLAGETLSAGIHDLTLTATDFDDGSGTAWVTITVEENQAPVANIESPADGVIVFDYVEVTLRGSGNDVEDGALSGDALAWSSSLNGDLGSGSELVLASEALQVGTHELTLIATDTGGFSDTVSVTITVEENQAPVAWILSPEDASVFPYAAAITLTGYATDPDEDFDDSSLVWTSDIDGELGSGPFVRLEGGALSAGDHVIILTATDAGSLSGIDRVTITVDANQVPVAVILSPADGSDFDYNESVTLTGWGFDAEEGLLEDASLVWSSDVDGELGTGAQLLLDREVLTAGIHNLTLTATDPDSLAGYDSVIITVGANQVPMAVILSPVDGSDFDYNESVTCTGWGFDAEEGLLEDASLVWSSDVDGELGAGAQLLLDGEVLTAGVHNLTLTVMDSDSLAGHDSVTIAVAANQGPVVEIATPQDGEVFTYEESITLKGWAFDAEEGRLEDAALVWTSDVDGEIGSGEEVALAAGELSGTVHLLSLTATDSGGEVGVASVTVSVYRGWVLRAPVDYASIQAALDAGMLGDTVLVAAGNYNGSDNKNLDFGGMDLALRSESGSDSTIIDCEGDGRGFSFTKGETSAASVDGFTITGGGNVELGAGLYCSGSSPTLSNLLISGNGGAYESSTAGGGIYCADADPVLVDCSIVGNEADKGGGIYAQSSSSMLDNCVVSGNGGIYGASTAGGGIYFSDADPTLMDCSIAGNQADEGGGIYARNSSPMLDNCVVSGNVAGNGGGMLSRGSLDGEAATLTNCFVVDNSATSGGGGLACTFGSSPLLMNCTFSNNDASGLGGGLALYDLAMPTVTNCILWGDIPDEIAGGNFFADAIVSYCDVEGGYAGEGNVDADPLFADAEGGDYHLSDGSPCIDAGTADGAPSEDFEGDSRPEGENVDVGADEYVAGNAAGLELSLSDYVASYSPGDDLSFTIEIENTDTEAKGLTRAVFWSVSPAYEQTLYDGPEFAIAGATTFTYPFSLTIAPIAPLGSYTVGVTIYDDDTELSSDSFQFEME